MLEGEGTISAEREETRSCLVSHGVAVEYCKFKLCVFVVRPTFSLWSLNLIAKTMAPSNDVEQFRSVLRKSRSIVAIAGAGLSAASGSITFKTKANRCQWPFFLFVGIRTYMYIVEQTCYEFWYFLMWYQSEVERECGKPLRRQGLPCCCAVSVLPSGL
jgi:hypothetical protein